MTSDSEPQTWARRGRQGHRHIAVALTAGTTTRESSFVSSESAAEM
jgi:hypothetical protein